LNSSRKVYPKPVVRKTRQTEAKQETEPKAKAQTVINSSPKLLVALSGIRVGEVEVEGSKFTLAVNETAEKTSMAINLIAESHNIGFAIELSGGTWLARTITYNGRRFFSADPVTAYDTKSFGCGDLRLSDGKTVVMIENFQLQPLFNPADGEKLEKFANTANDCVGFFSPAIWGALFVVILLVMILSCGLTMMMDIKTMDRFDDPKGKTITINAQE
jgi:V-type H+-transporting ATPase S1 subunit